MSKEEKKLDTVDLTKMALSICIITTQTLNLNNLLDWAQKIIPSLLQMQQPKN